MVHHAALRSTILGSTVLGSTILGSSGLRRNVPRLKVHRRDGLSLRGGLRCACGRSRRAVLPGRRSGSAAAPPGRGLGLLGHGHRDIGPVLGHQ